MTTDILLEKLEEQLYSNPEIVNSLLDEVTAFDRTGANVFTPSTMAMVPSLKSVIKSMISNLAENITELCSAFREFPPENFSPSNLDVKRVKAVFSKCRIIAENIASALGPLYKMVLATSDINNRNIIHGLHLETPRSVYEYPKWISDCTLLSDMALEIVDPQSTNFVSNTLDEDLQINPINVRILRCLDDKDPLAKSPIFSKDLERFGHIEVIVSDGQLSLPDKWFESVGPLICFPSTNDPVLLLSPIDNFAQMLRSCFSDNDAHLEWLHNDIDTLKHIYVIRDSSKLLTIPADLLEAACIPAKGDVHCKILCLGISFDLWELETLDAWLEEVDIVKLLA